MLELGGTVVAEDKELLEWVKQNKPALDSLIRHAGQIEQDYNYNAAKRLVWATWRKAVIGLSGLLVALAVLYDNLRAILANMLKGLLQ